jgi:uncharacterized protein YktB (UPF0637 family)
VQPEGFNFSPKNFYLLQVEELEERVDQLERQLKAKLGGF